jgi:hypothetical protein
VISEWCENEDIHLDVWGSTLKGKRLKKPPTKIRCPKCKKRFKPFVRECQDNGCWHLYLPKHKKK